VVKVENITVKRPVGKRNGIIVLKVSDKTGKAFCKFFGGKLQAIKKAFPIGKTILLGGEVEKYRNMLEFHHPESVIIENEKDQKGSIVAVYSETEGLSRRRIRGFVRKALDMAKDNLKDPMPKVILGRQKLLPLLESLEMIHFPRPSIDFDLLRIFATEGHKRLVFEELFMLRLGVALRRKNNRARTGISFSGSATPLKKLKNILPFDITKAQRKAVNEIIGDMKKSWPMNRLLQGDVGSGKTAVAMFAAVTAIQDGFQVAIMAPTEMLARQHMETFKPIFSKLGFSGLLLTGQMPHKEIEGSKKEIKKGKTNLIIGTHSLFQNSVEFQRLGLAIIDEQHRFGVDQRRRLVKKGKAVDILYMTATPIPRTLAMTAYGDLDISVIDQKPKGRKTVKTKVLEKDKKTKAFDRVRALLSKGRQGFIIYPLVENIGEKEMLDAVSESEKLAKREFKDFKVGLLHGKMRPVEKEKISAALANKDLDLLVATTVVEVGIDVPGASIMVIEHAERFGLAQLHQLRGRVGRSSDQGECFLIVHDSENERAAERLAILETTNDGMVLADKDLELRGQGDLLGTRQHGLPPLKIANLSRDINLMKIAGKEAESLLKKDPGLDKNQEHKDLGKALERWWGKGTFID